LYHNIFFRHESNMISWLMQTLRNSATAFPSGTELPAETLQDLLQRGLLSSQAGRCRITLQALALLGEGAALEREQLAEVLFFLQQLYQKKRTQRTTTNLVAAQLQRPIREVGRHLAYLSDLAIFIKPVFQPETGFVAEFALSDVVLSASLWGNASLPGVLGQWSLRSFSVDGYKPFLRAQIPLAPLVALLGPSGSGKTCLIAAMQLLRYVACHPLSRSIDPWWEGRKIFTTSNPEAVRLGVEISTAEQATLRYEVEIHGEGPPKIFRERCVLVYQQETFHLLSITAGRGLFFSVDDKGPRALPALGAPNQLWLSHAEALQNPWLLALRNFLSGIRCYFSVEPMLSSYESYLATLLRQFSQEQHNALQAFLQKHLQGFEYFLLHQEGTQLICKERAMREEVPWVDTAESFRRLFALAVFAYETPAPLVCLDTPSRGIAPALLPVMWGLLQKISQRSQLIASLDALDASLQKTAMTVSLSTQTGRPLAKNNNSAPEDL
jgi:hypothetical protein